MQAEAQTRCARRIAIVTAGQIGSNPRVVKEAQALHDAGFEVTVVALRTLASVEPRDQSILRDAPWQYRSIDLRARWRRLPARLAQIGFRAGARWTSWPTFCDLAFSEFTPRLAMAAAREPADLYIAHYPAALPAAAYAARRHGARYAFDAEDFHPGDLPSGPRHDASRRCIAAIERRYLPGCAHVTAASPGIAEAYEQTYGLTKPRVVLNTFPLAQAPKQATASGSAIPGPSVYWFSQTIGPDRGLESAMRAVGMAKTRPHLYLRGTPADGFVEALCGIASAVGAADRLHVLVPEAPHEMERLAAQYDIALVAETGATVNRRIALTNKVFTYLLAGVPPLMSDIAAHRGLAIEAGLGEFLYANGEASALAEGIDALLSDPVRLRNARSFAFRLGRERYHWEIDAQALVNTVQKSIGGLARGGQPQGRLSSARGPV